MTENYEPVFVYKNRGNLTAEQIIENGLRVKSYCEEKGYLQGGSLSISVPMSRCGSELKWMVDYCHNRGISKILVDSLLDIGRTPGEVDATAQILRTQGFHIEMAKYGLICLTQNEAHEQDEDMGMKMGGI